MLGVQTYEKHCSEGSYCCRFRKYYLGIQFPFYQSGLGGRPRSQRAAGTPFYLINSVAGIIILGEPSILLLFLGGILIIVGIWQITKGKQ